MKGFTGAAITGPIPVSGEVIAVGDSGIDYQSCFFDGPGAVAPPDGTAPPDPTRKVIKYVTTYADGVDFTGHGTAVSGVIAGQSSLPGFSDYNGLTPDAKLYVIDLGLGAGIVRRTPWDRVDPLLTRRAEAAPGYCRFPPHSAPGGRHRVGERVRHAHRP